MHSLIAGVHTWNGGGVGIAVNSYQTRLAACYLDYNTLVIQDPEQTVVENTVSHCSIECGMTLTCLFGIFASRLMPQAPSAPPPAPTHMHTHDHTLGSHSKEWDMSM